MKKLLMAVLSVGAFCAHADIQDLSTTDGKTVHVEHNLAYGPRTNKSDEGAGYPPEIDALRTTIKTQKYNALPAADRLNLDYLVNQLVSEPDPLDPSNNNKILAHATAQTYDIFYPETVNANTKVVLHVHGGTWMLNGDAGLFLSSAFAEYFPTYVDQANVIVYSMNYQLLPNYYLSLVNRVDAPGIPTYTLSATAPEPVPEQDATFDGMLSDIDLMVTEVKADLERRFPDQAPALKNRFIIWGESAGAHLASLYAYDESNPVRLNLDLDHALTPRVLINMAGPVDLASSASVAAWTACGNIGFGAQSADQGFSPVQVISKLLAGDKDKNLYSVDKLVTAGATPTVLDYNKLSSTAGAAYPSDNTIPYQQYELISTALLNAGVPVRSQVNDMKHGQEYTTFAWALGAADELMNEAPQLTVVETGAGFEVSGNAAAVGRYVFHAWGGYGTGDPDDPRAWANCERVGQLTAGESLSVTAQEGEQRFFLLASQSVCTRLDSLTATITTSSGSYFETGYIPNENTEFYADFTTPNNTYSGVLVGARNGSDAANMLQIAYSGGNTTLNVGFPYSGSWDTTFSVAKKDHVLLTCKSDKASLVNLTTGASATRPVTVGQFVKQPVCLLAQTKDYGTTFADYGGMSVRELKFSEEGVAKHDYVPVKVEADGRLTFLDLVTGKVLTAECTLPEGTTPQFTPGTDLGVAGLLAKSSLYSKGLTPATLKVKIGDDVYTSETTVRGGTLVFSNPALAAALSGKEVKSSTFAFDEEEYLAEADGGEVVVVEQTSFPGTQLLQSIVSRVGNWMICLSNETYGASDDERYIKYPSPLSKNQVKWIGANLSYRASPADGFRVLDFTQMPIDLARLGEDCEFVDPFTMYVKGAEGDAKLPHVIKYWDRTQGHQVNFDPSEDLLTATCPPPMLGELTAGKVSVRDFDPTGITHYLLTLEVGEIQPPAKATLTVKIGDAVYTSETTERGGTLVFSNPDLAAALSGKVVTSSTFAFDEDTYLAEAGTGTITPLDIKNFEAPWDQVLRSIEIKFDEWKICFSNETCSTSSEDQYLTWDATAGKLHWKGVNLSFQATPEDGSRVLNFSKMLEALTSIDAVIDNPFTVYVKGAEGDAKLPHVIKYWDRTQDPQVIFNPSEDLLTATCPTPTLDELAAGKVSVPDFDPTGITHYLLTLEVPSIEGGETENCFWTGRAVTPPLKVGGKHLTPVTDYTWTYAEMSSTITTVGTYKVTFTGQGNYSGTLNEVEWNVWRVSYSWPDSHNGTWRTAAWTGAAADHWYPNFDAYKDGVSPYPDGAFGHDATIRQGVVVELGADPLAVHNLNMQGDTIQNGTLAAGHYNLYGDGTTTNTFKNVVLSGNMLPDAKNPIGIIPAEAGGVIAFEGNNTIGDTARLQVGTQNNAKFIIRNGATSSASLFTLWRDKDMAIPQSVGLTIDNATLTVPQMSTMTNDGSSGSKGGIYNLAMSFKLGADKDPTVAAMLQVTNAGMTLSSGATLSVDVGQYATTKGTYQLIQTKKAITYGEQDCAAFCAANKDKITGTNASYAYDLEPATNNKGVNVGVNLVIREKLAVVPEQSVTLTYNGKEQTVTMTQTPEAGHYVLGGVTSGTDAGTYYAKVTPAEGYAWSDTGTHQERTVEWEIAKMSIEGGWTESRYWTSEPVTPPLSVSIPNVGTQVLVWNVDYTVMTNGVLIETAAEMPVDIKSYAVTFKGLGNYSGTFTPTPYPTSKAGENWSIKAPTYTWNAGEDGNWATASWSCDVSDYMKDHNWYWPQGVGHAAVIDGHTVALTGGDVTNVTYTLTLKNGASIKNGTIEVHDTAIDVSSNAKAVFENVHFVTKGNRYEIDPAANGVVEFRGDNTFEGKNGVNSYLQFLHNRMNAVMRFKDGVTQHTHAPLNFWGSTSMEVVIPKTIEITNAVLKVNRLIPTWIDPVLLSIALGENNAAQSEAGDVAPLKSNGELRMPVGSTLTVDAGLKGAGTYPLVRFSSWSTKDEDGGVDYMSLGDFIATATAGGKAITGVADGCVAEIVERGSTGIDLVIRVKSATEPTIAEGLVYNATQQDGCTLAGTHVTLGGTTSATDAGTYTLTATPLEGYAWNDGTYAEKTYTWRIAPAMLGDCYAYFYETDYWYPNKLAEGHAPTNVQVTNAAGKVLYKGPVNDQFTCAIYTNATMLGVSSTTVNVGATKYYVTLTAKENGNFSGTTGTAAPWTLDRVKYEFTGTGEKTWREENGFWTVNTPAGYIAAAEQAYPNSARELRGHWASLGSAGGPLTVKVDGSYCVDELELKNGDVTIAGDPNSDNDKFEARAWNFRVGKEDKRNTYILRDLDILGTKGDRLNLNESYTTIIVEGTNYVHKDCIWQFSGNNTPKNIVLVFRNGATTITEPLYSWANVEGLATKYAIAFTNATLRASFTGSSLFAYDVSFTLGELNKSREEDKDAAAVWSGGSIYLSEGSSITVDATEKGVGTYPLVKADTNKLKTDKEGFGWPDAIAKATIKVAPDYRAKLVLSSDGKALDLVIFHKGLILSFGPAPTPAN